MKKLIIFTLFLTLGIASFCAESQTQELFNLSSEGEGVITLQQARELALKENSDIKIAQKNIEIYEQMVRQYWSYIYPQIFIAGDYTRVLHSPELSTTLRNFELLQKNLPVGIAEADLLLWSGGAVSGAKNIARFSAQASEKILEETQNKIIDLVNTLCYGIALSSALSKVQQENLSIAQDHLNQIKQKYDKGLASDLDVLNQEVKVSNCKPPLISAKSAYDLGLLTLRSILNKDPEQPLFITMQIEDLESYKVPPLETLYEQAENLRPELQIADLQVAIAREAIDVAKADNYGQVVAYAQALYAGNSDKVIIPMSSYNSTYGTAVGIKFKLSLFEGFKVSSIIKQKELAAEQAELRQKDARRNIRIEVKNAWFNLAEALQRLQATKGTIQQARTNLERTNLRYRNGLASRLDLDDSALLLHNAELGFIQAVHDGFKAISNLNYAVGKEVITK